MLEIRLLPSQREVLEGSGNAMLFSNVKAGWSLPSFTAGCQIVSFQYIIFLKKKCKWFDSFWEEISQVHET